MRAVPRPARPAAARSRPGQCRQEVCKRFAREEARFSCALLAVRFPDTCTAPTCKLARVKAISCGQTLRPSSVSRCCAGPSHQAGLAADAPPGLPVPAVALAAARQEEAAETDAASPPEAAAPAGQWRGWVGRLQHFLRSHIPDPQVRADPRPAISSGGGARTSFRPAPLRFASAEHHCTLPCTTPSACQPADDEGRGNQRSAD